MEQISAACGVAVDRARNGIGQALSIYHQRTHARKTAAPISGAEERLDYILTLSNELKSLNASIGEGVVELHLRHWLRMQLDWPDLARKRFIEMLEEYIRTVERVKVQLGEEINSQRDPPKDLAQLLDKIWVGLLEQKRTISSANNGSPFVRFVISATELLPNHWPWRLPESRHYQSLDAFTRSLRRELDT